MPRIFPTLPVVPTASPVQLVATEFPRRVVRPPCGLTPVVSGTGVDPHYATPYYSEWGLSVQRQLNRAMVAEVGYFGSKGTRVAANSIMNYQTLGVSAAATATNQSTRAYPNYGSISNHKTSGNSEFNSLQARLQESTKSGISFLLSYTYGKSFDTTSSAQNATPTTLIRSTRRLALRPETGDYRASSRASVSSSARWFSFRSAKVKSG